MFLVCYILHWKLFFFQLALQYLCIAQYITQACSYYGICLLPTSLFWNLHRGWSFEEITGFTNGITIYVYLYLFYFINHKKKLLRFFLFLAKAQILLVILFWMKIS